MVRNSVNIEQYEQKLQRFASDSDIGSRKYSAESVGHGSINVAKNMVESSLETGQENRTQAFYSDNADSIHGIQELVHDLVKQLEHAASTFLSRLDELCTGVSVDGEIGKSERIHEHAAFQRDIKDRIGTSQGKHECTTSGLLESKTHCMACFLKLELAHRILVTPCQCNTSFLNGCKCARHSNVHRKNSATNATKSSGYITKDASSVCMGTDPRCDKVCVDSNPQWNHESVPKCVLECSRLRDWGLTGNDYVQRHIVTSSPIIATLRDLKPDEI
ncbi:Hypothetical predicted protein [Paramuricea clavata]|uniref:Uncharacterized protein n=1 Tax=Paramuricea clavata TaxID=317549 RepID=A0A6S7L6A4_PARCT|nr:Hypothetical predicted protein [Paramuricea clavata]